MTLPKLAPWLEQYKIEDNPPHPDFSSKIKPDGLKCFALEECVSCLPDVRAAHPSYQRASLREPLPENTRPRYKVLRTLAWLIHRVAREFAQLEGSQDGYLFNAAASNNFADFLDWTIVSATGNVLVLQAPEGVELRRRVIYTYRFFAPDPGENGFFYISSSNLGTIQPSDEGEFGPESCMHGKSRPKLVQIRDCDPETRTITTAWDQDVDACMWPGIETNPNPSVYTFKTWRQAGDPERWQRVREPHPFPGRLVHRKRYSVETINALDPNGRIRLLGAGSDTAIANFHPPNAAAGIPNGTFQVLGHRRDNPEIYDTLSSDAWDRTRIQVIDPNVPSYRTTTCFGDRDWNDNALPDWRLTYDFFLVTYIYYAPDKPTHWSGMAGCVHAEEDNWNSVNNLKPEAGSNALPEGKHHFCNLMYGVRVETPVIEGGIQVGVTYTMEPPAGLVNFPKTGRVCIQHNECPQYEYFEPRSDGDARNRIADLAFSFWYVFGRVWKNLLHGCDWKRKQLLPGFSSYRNWTDSRVLHPSVKSTLGGVLPLHTPEGMHVQTYFPTFGLPVGEVESFTDEDGPNLRLKRRGAHENADTDFAAVDMTETLSFPTDGHLPAVVPGYKTKRDPIDYGSTAAGSAIGDPNAGLKYYSERSGLGNLKDEGTIVGRGPEEYSHVAEHPEPLVVPSIPLTSPDELPDPVYDRSDTEVEVYTVDLSRPSIQGNPVGLILRLKAYRQSEKTPRQLVQGVIHSITSLGGNVFRIQWENGPHQYSTLAGPPGFKFDEIHSFRAGGTVVALRSWAYEHNYHGLDKFDGGQDHKARSGDALVIDYNDGSIDLTQLPMVTSSAKACEGTMDPTWGSEHIVRRFQGNGYFQGDAGFLYLSTDALAGDVYGAMIMPDAVAAFDQASGDTTIGIQPSIALNGPAMWMRNRRTHEIIQIVSASYATPGDPTGGALVGVVRGVVGTTAAAITAGDHLQWILLQDGTNLPLTSRPENQRPGTLGAMQLWLDSDHNRIYFGAVTGGDVLVRYTSDKKDQTSSASVAFANFTVPQYSEWDSGISYSDNVGHPRTLEYAFGGSLTETAGGANPSAKGQYKVYASGTGTMVFRMHLDDAGRMLLVDIDLERELADPGVPVGLQNWSTEIRRRDVTEHIDESGALAAAGSAVVGCTGAFYCLQAVWYPDDTFKVYVTQYNTNAWVEVPSSAYIAQHGTGKIWVFESYRQELLTTYGGAKVCFKIVVKRILHNSRPAASMYNGLIDAVNSLSSCLISLSGGDPLPVIYKRLSQETGYLNSDWGPRFDAAYVGPGVNGYHVHKGAVLKLGINHLTQSEGASQACVARQVFTIDGNPPTDYLGYGLIQRATVDLADYCPGAAANPLGYLRGRKFDGSSYVSGTWYGDEDPAGDLVYFPVFHGTTTDGGGPENWISGGHAGDMPEIPGQFVIYENDQHFADSGGGSLGLTGNGPGLYGIVVGGARYTNWPFWFWPDQEPAGGNSFIGSDVPSNEGGSWSPPGPGAIAQIWGSGATFGFHELMKKVPKGTTIEKARLRIKVADLQTQRGTYSAFVNDDREIVATGTRNDSTTADGVALVAGRIVDQTYGTMAYDVIASVNVGTGAIVSDEWCLVDVQAMLQALCDTYRNSRYKTFGFVPSIAVGSFGVISDGLALVQSLLPSIEYGCYIDPENTTDWKDAGGSGFAPRPGLADIDYVSSASGSNVSWTAIQIGPLELIRSYPETEYGLEPPSRNLPPFAAG